MSLPLPDMEARTRLLEDGTTSTDSADDIHRLFQKQVADERKGFRRAQHLLVLNVAIGLLLGLAVATFSVKPGYTFPWMHHRLQRVFLLLFSTELLLFFVIPPIVLLWRLGSRIDTDSDAEQNRDSASIILLALCEFVCGLWALAMSAFSVYTGKTMAAAEVGNGLITLCSFGMGASLIFSLFGNPKLRMARRLKSRALRQEAELSVTGAIMNMIVAISAALSLAQSSFVRLRFSVVGVAEYPIMFVGAFLLVKALAQLVSELLRYRNAAFRRAMDLKD
ncbi:hypothetical protein Efla_004853 [Eimeria flavescens]